MWVESGRGWEKEGKETRERERVGEGKEESGRWRHAQFDPHTHKHINQPTAHHTTHINTTNTHIYIYKYTHTHTHTPDFKIELAAWWLAPIAVAFQPP
jgi:hypothetical protein